MLLAGSLESFLQLLGVLIIFAFVLLVTYLTTRWMGGFQQGRSGHKNLHIVETVGVGSNKMISIVEAGNKYLVVAIGKDEVHLLTELTREELKDLSFLDEQEGMVRTEGFAEILDKLKNNWPKKRD